jgi:DNA repair exonuclease SbcCD ATPase subunit
MLIIKDLEWGDCFSYGKSNKLSLNENTITQLIGENGTGKSSIALIIQEIFYNKNSKNIKKADIPNRNSAKSYWMKASFSYNGKEYLISLERKSTLNIKIIEDDVDISSHTATDSFKTIEKLFGIDFKLFVQLIYQSTTDGLSFLTATDTNRKKFLIDLFRLNEYDAYHALFKELVSESSTYITKIGANIETISNWIRKNENIPDPRDLVEVPEQPSEEELWVLKDKATRIKEINRKINDNNKLQSLLRDIKFDDSLVSQSLTSTQTLNSRVGELTAEIRSLNAFINKIKVLHDKCPTCEQELDNDRLSNLIADASKKLEEAESEKQTLALEIKAIEHLNAKITENKNRKQEWESIYTKIDRTLTKELEDINSLNSRISEIENRIKVQKAAYNQALQENLDVEKFNNRIKIIMEQLDGYRAELSSASEKLREAEEELGLLEILKKAFSTNGLVAYELENLVKDLEELSNVYLAELSDGRFTLLFSISSDKLNVNLTDNGNTIDISALSSGELARVNTATLLAIRKLMNSISSTQINILFLDEVINVLDEQGRERLVEVLLKEEGLNTFLVSHGWSHPLLAKVIVTKDNGISRLTDGR